MSPSKNPRLCLVALVFHIVLLGGHVGGAEDDAQTKRPIKVHQPKRLSAEPIPAKRTPLGIPEDYKPWIVKLKDERLMIVAFHAGRNPVNEYAVFWRSADGGRTWGKREPRKDVPGREFAVTCLADGSLVMTCHFLEQDAMNKAGYTYSKLFRSGDDGATWQELRVGPEGFPAKVSTNTDRNVFEIPASENPKKMIAYVGISTSGLHENKQDYVSLWRSTDGGKTWDKTLKPDVAGWDDYDGFFGQSSTYRSPSGKLLHVVRVDRRGKYWKLGDLKLGQEEGDQGDRMMIWKSIDNGRKWSRLDEHGDFGTYGEMYPRFLKLADGRLLFTFTVRSNSTDDHALGLRALISYDDGETWDFAHDRLIIDDINQGASGGGYGNTVQMKDGSLVSCYSHRGTDGKTHVEAVRWRMPEARN
ncbi:MAG: hypothetical protein CMJ64_02240 [Planctomycetaceae bacterium]|nr:hypothetical protein [Planctomycetaceae bacterium]